MGVGEKGKKAGRFFFIGMPKNIFGVESLKMGNRLIGSLWQSLSLPLCPNCDKGTMRIPDDSVSSDDGHQTLYPWSCHSCGFKVFAGADTRQARQMMGDMRAQAMSARLSSLEKEQIAEIAKSHRNNSRAYYAAALFALLGFLYMVASGASLMTCINWLVIGMAVFVIGLVRAYRAWQVRTGTLFVEGAFIRWLQNERWFS